MKKQPKINEVYDPTTTYVFGFTFSLLLTIVPYLMVVNNRLSGNLLIATLVGIAVSQMVIQLYFFLHLGSERKPRWNLMIFLFMAMVVFIIVIGSLWIMNNLNYHAQPKDVDTYIQNEELIKKRPN